MIGQKVLGRIGLSRLRTWLKPGANRPRKNWQCFRAPRPPSQATARPSFEHVRTPMCGRDDLSAIAP
jgi:hypothetical protein